MASWPRDLTWGCRHAVPDPKADTPERACPQGAGCHYWTKGYAMSGPEVRSLRMRPASPPGGWVGPPTLRRGGPPLPPRRAKATPSAVYLLVPQPLGRPTQYLTEVDESDAQTRLGEAPGMQDPGWVFSWRHSTGERAVPKAAHKRDSSLLGRAQANGSPAEVFYWPGRRPVTSPLTNWLLSFSCFHPFPLLSFKPCTSTGNGRGLHTTSSRLVN